MKISLLIFCSMAIAILSVGPFVAAANAGEPAAAAKKATADEELLKDIATFEHAVGKTHGMTAEEIQVAAQKLKEAPEFQNKFLGIWTVQTPSDAWIVMEILYEVKPDLIIEAGTFHGGSAALWAIILEHINPDGRVVTIDIEDQRERKAIALPISKKRVEFLLGSSTDPKIVNQVRERTKGGKRVLVLLDSLHSKEHVAAELAAYTPMVSVGSYIIVQDTPLGAKDAIDEFLDSNDSFIADRKRERYPDTNSVRGYLKRIKP